MMTELLMTPLWGGNVAGIIIGGLTTLLGLWIFGLTVYKDFFKPMSDEEFTDIVLDELDEEEA